MVVCRLGDDDSKVLPLRTGSDGVGPSAVGMGESMFDIALGHLVHKCIGTHRCFVLLSWVGDTAAMLSLLGFVNYILFLLGHSFSVLGDDHSFIGESDDTWSGGLVGI